MEQFLRIFFLSFFISLVGINSNAQVNDDFNDGDFTANPTWAGSDTSFLIDNGWLRSDGPQVSSVIYLSTPNALFDSVEWNILLRLDFNPSTTNFVRIYLSSNSTNLTGSLNGYYIQLGEAGTAPDSLDIFKQTGTTSTKVFTGVSGVMTSSTTNSVRIKVTRLAGGDWNVYADKTGGFNFNLEGTFIDNTFSSTSFFGVVADYNTASRYNQYYFDDVFIQKMVQDTTKPSVLSTSVLSANSIDVLFSEAVDVTSVQTLGNYAVNNSIGNAATAIRDAVNFALVHLTFANSFQNVTNYSLSITGVKDLSGNVMNNYATNFSIYTPQPYDILINELMADPDPVVGWPSVEFVELYNRTSFPIDLGGWRFSDPSSTIILNAYTIQPDSFVILCRADSAFLFQNVGVAVLPLPSLPSLNNASDELTLKNPSNVTIHNVNFSSSWYNSSVKNDGGWSLEMINPNNPCLSNGNWTASNHPSGGTPGRQNSVYNTATTSLLAMLNIEINSSASITLNFNQDVNKSDAENVVNYIINQGIDNPQTAQLDSFVFSKVKLTFSAPLDSTLIYTIITNVANCAGTTISTQNQISFALPRKVEKFDVVIHEILPDPDPVVGLPNAEFVEIYNRSNKTFNTKNWTLSKAGSSGATLPDYLLLPDSFLILTSSSNLSLFSGYTSAIGLSSFPSLTNSADQILLRDNSGSLIHYLEYSDSWFGTSSKINGGWTLEMIDAENPCNGEGNWRPSNDPTGGTPGRKNSVESQNPDTILPRLIRAALEDANTLILYFNEPINNGSAAVATNYTIDLGVGNPAVALPVPFGYKTVQLEFVQNFQPKTIYTITVNNLSDCSGNSLDMSNTARFALPDTATAGDIIINEILFNPITEGYDFVELYNHSDKVLELSSLEIVEYDLIEPDKILEQSSLTDENYLLFPNEYVVITQKRSDVIQRYTIQNPDVLLEVSSVPNLPDDEGAIAIKIKNGVTIDNLTYSEKWHFGLLDIKDGVSLERINFDVPANNKSSWHSAASTVGFATPTYLNSQFSETGILEDAVSVSPKTFTPDNDGNNDYTFLEYEFAEPGFVANLTVFDAAGREIVHLAKNETLSVSGRFQWNGTNADNQKARVGIYFFYLEVFNLQGKVKRFKREIVLGAKLN
jgi:hypothetical protein